MHIKNIGKVSLELRHVTLRILWIQRLETRRIERQPPTQRSADSIIIYDALPQNIIDMFHFSIESFLSREYIQNGR